MDEKKVSDMKKSISGEEHSDKPLWKFIQGILNTEPKKVNPVAMRKWKKHPPL